MEDIEVKREYIPKFFQLSQKLKNLKENPKNAEPETSESRKSSGDTSDEEVDVTSYNSEDENLDCESNISKESCTNRKLRSSSSCSSLTVHVCTYEGCDKFFSRPYRLEQHIRTHTGERPFVCPDESCLRSYSRQQHLKRHIETSHQDKNEEEKLKCMMCDKWISNICNMRKHVQRYHEHKRYECSECGQTFIKQQHLQTHSYVHTGLKPYPCDYPGCEMRCMTPIRLKRHQFIHLKSRYGCPRESCQQKFDKYKDLQHHIVADHPKVCDICSRPFKQLRVLKKHRLTHENTKEAYFCTYPACDKYYSNLSNLTNHVKSKHQQLNVYECSVCEKRLSTKQKLVHHMAIHSPSYKRNYVSEKPRKPRKDKGCSRRDFASLLSGYTGNGEEDSMTEEQLEDVTEENTDESTSIDAT